jgi:hypothetical protein
MFSFRCARKINTFNLSIGQNLVTSIFENFWSHCRRRKSERPRAGKKAKPLPRDGRWIMKKDQVATDQCDQGPTL